MKLISHRGNVNGIKLETENKPEYIVDIPYDVEIDVWYVNDWYLGHDYPQYRVNYEFLSNKKFWIHAKNHLAIAQLIKSDLRYFWHETDQLTLTSKNDIWTFPGKTLIPGAIAVLPEMFPTWDITLAGGICSDFIERYK